MLDGRLQAKRDHDSSTHVIGKAKLMSARAARASHGPGLSISDMLEVPHETWKSWWLQDRHPGVTDLICLLRNADFLRAIASGETGVGIRTFRGVIGSRGQALSPRFRAYPCHI